MKIRVRLKRFELEQTAREAKFVNNSHFIGKCLKYTIILRRIIRKLLCGLLKSEK